MNWKTLRGRFRIYRHGHGRFGAFVLAVDPALWFGSAILVGGTAGILLSVGWLS